MAILIDPELKKRLREHVGHDIIVECYGAEGVPPGDDEVAIECIDCAETLISVKDAES